MGAPVGHPKYGGRQKGSLNKRTLAASAAGASLQDRLAAHGCDIDLELSRAILAKDIPMIEALAKVYPYILPKFRDIEPPKEDPFADADDGASDEDLIAAATS